MTVLDETERVLRDRFGFACFHEGQREVVEAVLRSEDVLVVRPTGSGKSLCYQLPAMLLEGVTVVVSPLIALMKDQLDALAARSVPAVAIHSGMSWEEQVSAFAALRRGAARLVYVAPERFRSERFLEALRPLQVALFAVDEAHCVSEWGHEFRPDYRRLGAARETLGRPPVLALTATATARVRDDIQKELAIPQARVFVSGFERPNLFFTVARVSTREEKIERLRALVHGLGSGAGIVYCATRKHVEEVADRLRGAGRAVAFYHAGLEDWERERVQDDFMSGRVSVLVATNAFGMGVDRPDIRFVAHFEMPRSLEAYYQECGRAGRDGEAARCVLLYNYADRRLNDFFIDEATPGPDLVRETWRHLEPERGAGPRPEATIMWLAASVADSAPRAGRGTRGRGRGRVRARPTPRVRAVEAAVRLLERAGHLRQGRAGLEVVDPVAPEALRVDFAAVEVRREYERERLEQLIRYASRPGCRTREILRYFGDPAAAPAGGRCEHCDVCVVETAPEAPAAGAAAGALPAGAFEGERTLLARKVLSCLARMGGSATRTELALCLAASRSPRVIEAGHDRLSTYGLLRGTPREELLARIDDLVLLRLVWNRRGRVSLTGLGIEVMAGRAPLPKQ